LNPEKELCGQRSDDTVFPTEVTFGPLPAADGLLVAISIRDASERREADEVLHKSLREKEVLLKEIHHRVKNNLQITTSLLNLQAARLPDTASRDALAESADRVRSMALVHETLHEARSLEQINFSEYAHKIAEGLMQSYVSVPGSVTLRFAIEDVPLSIDSAIHCGLLINELVSNSLKHAFIGRERGEITIRLTRNAQQQGVLEIGDDGVGLPADLDFRRTESLGLQLVTILAKQLGAEVELERAHGTTFRLTFSQSPEGARPARTSQPGA
jgi:two-component sensor histidine kinase